MNNTLETDPLAATSVAGVPLPGVDRRTRAAKRWRDLFMAYAVESGALGQGMARENLCRQAATMTVARERLDAATARGELVDADTLVRLGNALGRVLGALGLASWTDATPPPPEKPDPAALFAKVRDPDHWRKEPGR
jgi:hypothetical protein